MLTLLMHCKCGTGCLNFTKIVRYFSSGPIETAAGLKSNLIYWCLQFCYPEETTQFLFFWNILLWTQLVLLLLDGLCSTQSACTTGSDETDLATSWGVSPDGGGLANMLVVTTSEWMLNRLQGTCERSVLKIKIHFWTWSTDLPSY